MNPCEKCGAQRSSMTHLCGLPETNQEFKAPSSDRPIVGHISPLFTASCGGDCMEWEYVDGATQRAANGSAVGCARRAARKK